MKILIALTFLGASAFGISQDSFWQSNLGMLLLTGAGSTIVFAFSLIFTACKGYKKEIGRLKNLIELLQRWSHRKKEHLDLCECMKVKADECKPGICKQKSDEKLVNKE